VKFHHLILSLHYRIMIGGVLITILLFAGCTPLVINRTLSLKGLPPTTDSNLVTVMEESEVPAKPYQIVGKVSVFRDGTRVTKSASIERIRTYAAQMGADGVIGFHQERGGGICSGIAVKWLTASDAKQSRQVHFIISLLPVFVEGKANAKSTEYFYYYLRNLLERRGFYMERDPVSGFEGGIAHARTLDFSDLQALGGDDTDLLMEVSAKKTSEHLDEILLSWYENKMPSSYQIIEDKNERLMILATWKAQDKQHQPPLNIIEGIRSSVGFQGVWQLDDSGTTNLVPFGQTAFQVTLMDKFTREIVYQGKWTPTVFWDTDFILVEGLKSVGEFMVP
jgi:hypothetical protein